MFISLFMLCSFVFIFAYKYNQAIIPTTPPQTRSLDCFLLPQWARPPFQQCTNSFQGLGRTLALVLVFIRSHFDHLFRQICASIPKGTLARVRSYCVLAWEIHKLQLDRSHPQKNAVDSDSLRPGVESAKAPTAASCFVGQELDRYEDLRRSMATLKAASERLTEETAWLDVRVQAVVACTHELGFDIDSFMQEVNELTDRRIAMHVPRALENKRSEYTH